MPSPRLHHFHKDKNPPHTLQALAIPQSYELPISSLKNDLYVHGKERHDADVSSQDS